MRSSTRSRLLVASYIWAAGAANLAVAQWGQAALVFTAWVLIPFDLVARDVLHDRWSKGGKVWPRMFALILAGGLVAGLINVGAWRIALASVTAFVVAGAVDAVVYHSLRDRSRLARINASNAFSSVTDSIVFPLVAFSDISLSLCVGQSLSKFLGGVVWSILFVKVFWRHRWK